MLDQFQNVQNHFHLHENRIHSYFTFAMMFKKQHSVDITICYTLNVESRFHVFNLYIQLIFGLLHVYL